MNGQLFISKLGIKQLTGYYKYRGKDIEISIGGLNDGELLLKARLHDSHEDIGGNLITIADGKAKQRRISNEECDIAGVQSRRSTGLSEEKDRKNT